MTPPPWLQSPPAFLAGLSAPMKGALWGGPGPVLPAFGCERARREGEGKPRPGLARAVRHTRRRWPSRGSRAAAEWTPVVPPGWPESPRPCSGAFGTSGGFAPTRSPPAEAPGAAPGEVQRAFVQQRSPPAETVTGLIGREPVTLPNEENRPGVPARVVPPTPRCPRVHCFVVAHFRAHDVVGAGRDTGRSSGPASAAVSAPGSVVFCADGRRDRRPEQRWAKPWVLPAGATHPEAGGRALGRHKGDLRGLGGAQRGRWGPPVPSRDLPPLTPLWHGFFETVADVIFCSKPHRRGSGTQRSPYRGSESQGCTRHSSPLSSGTPSGLASPSAGTPAGLGGTCDRTDPR